MRNAPKHFTVSTSPSSVKANEQPGNEQNVAGETFGNISHLHISNTCSKIPFISLNNKYLSANYVRYELSAGKRAVIGTISLPLKDISFQYAT